MKLWKVIFKAKGAAWVTVPDTWTDPAGIEELVANQVSFATPADDRTVLELENIEFTDTMEVTGQ